MKIIYKFRFNHQLEEFIMHKNAKILSVQNQMNTLCLWAEVDTSNDNETRSFFAYNTGQAFGYEDFKDFHHREYIGTVLLRGGYDVVHVYELIKRK
jgi:hypothetical protein